MATRADGPELTQPARGGEAFCIDDIAKALRWSGLVGERGYRLHFIDSCDHADEAIEVCRASQQVATIYRGRKVVWSSDRGGYTRVFGTLSEALLAIAPLTQSDRRWMATGPAPACLQLAMLKSGTPCGLFGRALAAFHDWRRA